MASFDLLVVGNSVLDLLVSEEFGRTKGDDAWTAGNVQFLDSSPQFVLGGCGAAAAYSAARCGARVVLQSNPGDDVAGHLLKEWLSDAGVHLVGERVPETAVNVISVDGSGRRRSSYFTGHPLAWRKADEAGDVPTWFFAAGYGGVQDGDFEAIVERLSAARVRGSKTAFDPGPWFTDRVPGGAMAEMVPNLDLLLGTETELGIWFGDRKGADLVEAALGAGARSVVLKLGEAGALGGDGNGIVSAPADPVDARNTVGAGDTFNGSLLADLAADMSLQDALTSAVRRAGKAVGSGHGVLGAFNPQPGSKT